MITEKKDIISEEIITEEEKIEVKWYDEYLEYIKKYGMQVGLVFLGTIPPIILGRSAVRKEKEQF